jgi:hypothetical protein
MELIRLADRGDLRQVEKEWQYEFIVYVLSTMGISQETLEGCFPESVDDFTVEHKMELRRCLKKEFITLVDDRDGGLKFYLEVQEGEQRDFVLIAEWKKCKFNYRADPTEVDPQKQMYVEVIADVWTIFPELKEEE